MKELGHESHILVADNTTDGDPSVTQSDKPGKLGLTIKRGLRRLYSDYLWRDKESDHGYIPEWRFARPSIDEIVGKVPFEPDLIIAYWTSYFVGERHLRELSQRFQAPVFRYLMDMAPITGGCHYAFDCEGYFNRCGRCPGIASKRDDDMSRAEWLTKSECLGQTPLLYLAASSQLMDQLGNGSLSREKPRELLPISVSPEFFEPRDSAAARANLNIPSEPFVIFFGAQVLHEKRKGMGLLLESLKIVAAQLSEAERKGVFLMYAGNGADLDFPFPNKYIGYVDRQGLADAYQAADLFACPSIEDSGPLMINESLMSGTPVVCFHMGVGRDLVHTGQTGYRAELGDAKDFADGLLSLIRQKPSERRAMRERCRDYALELLHPITQAKRLLELEARYDYDTLRQDTARVHDSFSVAR
jgi:glycosyltransferase involved in cell wall biosynthesis